MTYGDVRLGDSLADAYSLGVYACDVVVQIEHLSSSAQLAANRLMDDGVVMLEDVGLHRMAVEGGFLDDRHIAYAAHRHVQGTGDGGRGQGEDVDVFAHLLEVLLLRYAEALFLVDYREPEVAEFYVLLYEAVCADDHVDIAVPELLEDLLLLSRRAEPRQQLYADRVAVKAAQHRLIVLPREDCGGAEQSALLAVRHALEGGTQSYLCLAEADVSAQQSVHRDGSLHILLDLLAAAELVVGLLIREAGFKVVLPLVVAREGEALRLHTL